MDGAGRVYVADSGNHRVRRVAAGEVTTYAGLPSTGSDDGGLLKHASTHPQGSP